MNAIVIYKSKYGSTKQYAEWIAEELGCRAAEAKTVTPAELENYDAIVYGGGLYGETINGASLITKNLGNLSGKKLAVFSTGITPLECREYYDKMVYEKNFKADTQKQIKVFNYLGKMKTDELTPVHRAAIKTLKKIMSAKKNPTELETLLIKLCDADGDFTDRSAITELADYIKS